MSLERPPHLSPSSIETFEQCPLKYRLSRIDGMVSEPTDATLVGNFVHSVLESLLQLEPLERTFQMAQALLVAHWNEEYRERHEAMESELSAKDFKWRAYWCVENYFQMEDPTRITPAGVEEQIDVTVHGVTVHGFIDRWELIDGLAVVTDYKTGKKPKPWFQDAKFKQLAIYALALSIMKDVPPGDMRLMFVKDKTLLVKPATQQIIEECEERLVTVNDAINIRCRTGDFEPKPSKPGGLCDWCDYKGICPAWN